MIEYFHGDNTVQICLGRQIESTYCGELRRTFEGAKKPHFCAPFALSKTERAQLRSEFLLSLTGPMAGKNGTNTAAWERISFFSAVGHFPLLIMTGRRKECRRKIPDGSQLGLLDSFFRGHVQVDP